MTGNATEKPAQGALADAAKRNDIEAVKDLLRRGADVNGKEPWDRCALNMAVVNENVEIARLLIENGADVNGEDAPLRLAAYIGPVMCKFLLENGAQIDAVDNGGWTALMSPCVAETEYEASSLEIVRLLLDEGADLTVRTRGGETAQDIAESYGLHKVAQLLKETAELRCLRAEEEAAAKAAHGLASEKQHKLNAGAFKPKIIRELQP